MIINDLFNNKKHSVAEGRFQDEYPEYGGKDKNKAMTYDRNVGIGYEGEPWSDSNPNWSGDNPTYAVSTYEPDTVTLRGSDGTEKEYSPDSPEYQGVLDREYGIHNKLGQITKAFQKGINFNANRPRPYTNLATSDSTNDFSEPIKLGQYDVDFPEQTVDKFDAQSGQFNQQVIPSPNDPNAPFQKPVEPVKAKVPAADGSSNSATRSLNAKPDSNSKFVLYDPIRQQPVTQVDQKSAKPVPAKAGASKAAPIPANPRPGSWQELAKLNNITDPTKLRANTFIKTPDGEEVYVKKGDTLSGLAQRMRSKPGMSEQAPLINVPPGQQATTQPDGSTRISKPGSVSRADYAKNMAAYKAQTQTPEKIADFKQRMASGQGYADTERQANLQQQQQHFGKYADTGDLGEGDGFDDITTFSDLRTTDQGGKTNQTYTSGTIAKNPTTGQQQSLGRWDHTDPKTGKNYSGTNYIDPQGNAEVQKNYKESKKIKVDEVSLGDYGKKAPLSRAMALTNKFFGRDDPAAVAAADRTIANRTKGLARADARSRPYTAPPVDQDKQRRDLADKYPNIDELVRRAELRRDPQYDRADGQAYYDGRDAEQNYHRLKQIQRMIRGAELDEMDLGGATVNVPGQTPPVNKTNQSKSPSMYDIDKANRKEIASQFDPKSTYVNPYDKNTKALDKGSKAINTMADFEESIDHELAKYAVDSATGINEEPNQATLNVPGASFTANKNTNTLSGTTNVHGVDLTATRNLTPGGARTFSASTNVAPNLNMTATQKSADYTKGQLAGTKAVSANYTDTAGALGKPGQQHTATRTAGVGFGGASGTKVGKNYVDQYSVNESLERMQHLAGIKQSRV